MLTGVVGTHTLDQALYLFGTPSSVTGFLRSNRGVESENDDTFTIMLQYSGKQKNLLVTVKTAVVTHMKDQLRFFVRGTKGTYLKVAILRSAVLLGMMLTPRAVRDLPAREPGHCGARTAGDRPGDRRRGRAHLGHPDHHYRV
jgi:predicted dehydrogenase